MLLILLWLGAPWPYAAALGGLLVAAGFADLASLDRRLTAYNKALRMALLLRSKTAPPPGYRGRYKQDDGDINDYLAIKDQEQAGHLAKSTLTAESKKGTSFQEQEAALRELTERQKGSKSPRS